MEIKFDGNSAEFEIDFTYYDYPCLLEAANEFTDSCWIMMKEGKDTTSLKFKIEPKEDSQKIRDAVYSFLNFALGIMNRKIKNLLFEEPNDKK
jgi:hypothetical protein